MSYEILAEQTTIRGSSAALLATNVGSFLTDHIPELAYTSYYQDSSASTYWHRRFYAFDGLPFGLSVNANRSSNSPVSMFHILPVKISGTSGTIAVINTQYINPFTEQIDGVTYYCVTMAIAKVGTGYMIHYGGRCVYIGYLTSAIAGKVFVVMDLTNPIHNYVSYAITSGSGHYYYNNAVWSNNTESYYPAFCTYIKPDSSVIQTGSAVLSPVYLIIDSLWAEPMLLPGVYFITTNTLPSLFAPTEVAGVEVTRFDDAGIVIV